VNTLDDLRREAKFWLKQVRENHSGFCKRLRLAYPGAPANPGLRDIQHALARELGHENWKALTLALGHESAAAPTPEKGDPVSSFLGFACWDHHVHGLGDYRAIDAAAMRLLRKHPHIATANIYTAVVCGEAATVERLLAHNPNLVNQKGGVRGWEPILYLCYARLSLDVARDNALYIARLLLDRGANSDAYYMAGHSVYGTLVGVTGEGEQDAPPHPARDALYRLLLERGAEPYDIQVLYNTHFRGDVLWWLTLTWEHSVATGRERDWSDPDLPIFDMGGYGSGARFLLWLAIRKKNVALVEWLVARGANPHAGPPRAANLPQHSLYTMALMGGSHEIADLLLRHGASADVPPLSNEEAFIAACLRLDRPAVDTVLKAHPEYVQSPKALFAAAEQNRPDVASLLLDMGVSVNIEDEHRKRALHVAAASDARRVVALLIERGAEVDARERHYHATALGFACHYDHRAMIDLLAGVSRDVWCLGAQGKVDRLREVLTAEPDRARQVAPDGTTPLWWLPDEEPVALEVVELLLTHGADPAVKAKDGTMAADSARVLGLDRVVARLEAAILRSSG